MQGAGDRAGDFQREDKTELPRSEGAEGGDFECEENAHGGAKQE